MQQHEFTVESLKTRLDKYISEQLSEVSRSRIQHDIEGGCVEVNGGIITESKFVVRLNDKIVYKPSDVTGEELKPTNTALKILYNNHGLLVIDKPAGLTVHPGAGFKGETLASALLYKFKDIHLVGEDHRPGIVHRLDKDTSGVILVATTQEMYEHLKDAFLERKVKKEYIALVYGRVEKPHGFIETPIGKSKTDFRKQTANNPVEGKEAVTEYKVLEYLYATPTTPSAAQPPLLEKEGNTAASNFAKATSDKPRSISSFSRRSTQRKPREVVGAGVDVYTLIMVKLHTGRTHQIRVHFSSQDHPLMGDSLYGGKRGVLKGLTRQFLHAKKIEVQLPDKSWIEAESDFPQDLKQVLKDLDSKEVNKL